jgi:hypothetical protein
MIIDCNSQPYLLAQMMIKYTNTGEGCRSRLVAVSVAVLNVICHSHGIRVLLARLEVKGKRM